MEDQRFSREKFYESFLLVLSYFEPFPERTGTMQILKTIKSFGPAWRGMKAAFASENNFRVHLLAAVLVIALGFYLHIELNHWLWLVACIGAVFSVEYLNTAIEKLTDLISPGYHEQ